jgi:hypothetical protein
VTYLHTTCEGSTSPKWCNFELPTRLYFKSFILMLYFVYIFIYYTYVYTEGEMKFMHKLFIMWFVVKDTSGCGGQFLRHMSPSNFGSYKIIKSWAPSSYSRRLKRPPISRQTAVRPRTYLESPLTNRHWKLSQLFEILPRVLQQTWEVLYKLATCISSISTGKYPSQLDTATEEAMQSVLNVQSTSLGMLLEFFPTVRWSSVVLKPQHLPPGLSHINSQPQHNSFQEIGISLTVSSPCRR